MPFYTVQQIQHKWFLLDPQGRPVYLRRANHYGDGTHMPFNLRER